MGGRGGRAKGVDGKQRASGGGGARAYPVGVGGARVGKVRRFGKCNGSGGARVREMRRFGRCDGLGGAT
eukprot:3256907-Prymnesium_polylepis.1